MYARTASTSTWSDTETRFYIRRDRRPFTLQIFGSRAKKVAGLSLLQSSPCGAHAVWNGNFCIAGCTCDLPFVATIESRGRRYVHTSHCQPRPVGHHPHPPFAENDLNFSSVDSRRFRMVCASLDLKHEAHYSDRKVSRIRCCHLHVILTAFSLSKSNRK